jgi:hypothetical protein
MDNSLLDSDALNAFLLLVPVASSALTLPLALLLVWFYQRAVRAAMARRSQSAPPTSEAEVAIPRATASPTLTVTEWRAGTPLELDSTARVMQRHALAAPWRNAGVYAVAGMGFALFNALVLMVGAEVEFLPLRLIGATVLFAFPVALVTNLVIPTNRWTQARNVAIYALVITLVGGFRLLDTVVWWFAASGPPSLVLLAFMHRKVRTIGPLVYVFINIGILGVLVFAVPFFYDDVQWAVSYASVAIGADWQLFILIAMIIGFGIGGVLAWIVALGWLRRRYVTKQISDQSLQIDTIFATFAVWNMMSGATRSLTWALLALAAFGLYRALVSAGFKLIAPRTAGAAPRLLLLRVFGSTKRSEQVMARWRYVGSIEMIAGTDLTTTTLEPHEFLEFVRGGIANRYIQSSETLERHLAEWDLDSDFDGRYRINRFLCYDDTWRLALSRLAAASDAVLMDLRGFSPTNLGCVFEIQALVNLVPLPLVVLIVDSTTDVSFLQNVLDEAIATASIKSPNLGQDSVTLNVCRLTSEMNTAAARLVLGRVAQAAANSGRLQSSLATGSRSEAAAPV